MAIGAFKEQYQGLPGDIRNAERYWSDEGTLNGNGNGHIDVEEIFAAWHQLALSHMIIGNGFVSVEGGVSSGAYVPQLGAEVPKSRNLKNIGFGFRSGKIYASNGEYWEDVLGRKILGEYIQTGAPEENTSYLNKAVFNNETAFMIDKKIDDGKPGSGIFLVSAPDGTGKCIQGNSYQTDYDFDSEVAECIGIFIFE